LEINPFNLFICIVKRFKDRLSLISTKFKGIAPQLKLCGNLSKIEGWCNYAVPLETPDITENYQPFLNVDISEPYLAHWNPEKLEMCGIPISFSSATVL
jgi:hypothetical protein